MESSAGDGNRPHLCQRLAGEHGTRDQNAACVDRNVRDVREQRCAQLCGHPGRQILACRGGRDDHGRIVACADPARQRGGPRVDLAGQKIVTGHVHDPVGAVTREFAGGRTRGGNLHPAAQFVRHPAGDGNHFPGHPRERLLLRLGYRKHVRHQRTFASSRRSRTSSGTASGPSPTIRPSGRWGG